MNMAKKKSKKELVGYYYDGKNSYELFKDESGKETHKKVNYDYSGINHDDKLCNNKQKGRR